MAFCTTAWFSALLLQVLLFAESLSLQQRGKFKNCIMIIPVEQNKIDSRGEGTMGDTLEYMNNQQFGIQSPTTRVVAVAPASLD